MKVAPFLVMPIEVFKFLIIGFYSSEAELHHNKLTVCNTLRKYTIKRQTSKKM